MNFKQCQLFRLREDLKQVDKENIAPGEYSGIIGVYTCWLPEEFAKVGKLVDLKRGDGSWTHGWTVVEVYTSMSEEYVRAHERDHLTQAEASDKFTPNKGLLIK
jgi:hypothetical protein